MSDYFDRYPTITFERDGDGILLVRLHARDDADKAVVFTPQHHADWPGAFHDIAQDRANRVVILTGTGDAFIDDWHFERTSADPQSWDRIYHEGKHLLRRLLEIEVPVIAAVNGPATIHAELAVLSDITLASTTATFQDRAHVPTQTVPGDGTQIVWEELLGVNRSRYFLLTGQTLSAAEALSLGVVNEVLEPEKLLARAYELARPIAALPVLTARYTRVVLTQRLKRLLDDQVGSGLALEALASLDVVRLREEARVSAQAAAATIGTEA
jgi:enoyl-CoA hydratase/carnithine racemase